MGLERYRARRDFSRTSEPRGSRRKPKHSRSAPRRFVVQQHAARRLHYDFRLELDGVLKSWAVPKGPSAVPGERRLAAQTEDHPLEYADFEGVIRPGEYGAGSVLVWDRGTWQPRGDPRAALAAGDLSFSLAGEKLRGSWRLVRMRADPGARGKTSWLLIKARDAHARAASAPPLVEARPGSVQSGRSLEEVAESADRVWSRDHDGARQGASALDPAGLPGARRGRLPDAVAPQLPTLVDTPP